MDKQAHVAQLVERILGKDEVTGSNPVISYLFFISLESFVKEILIKTLCTYFFGVSQNG